MAECMFEVLSVFEIHCHLIARVRHLNRDGSEKCMEDYGWQGRQWFQHKRQVNGSGEMLMDDGSVAPSRLLDEGDSEQYLPEGRDWAMQTVPHMDDSSILDTIRSCHHRHAQGYNGCNDNVPFKPSQQDRDGCSGLVAHFQHLVGRYDYDDI